MAPENHGPGRAGVPDLLDHIERAYTAESPLPLLEIASAILATIPPPGRAERGAYLHALTTTGDPRARGLLAAVAALTPDDLERARIRRMNGVAPREASSTPPPNWLAGLSAPTITRAVSFGHVLEDGENILLGAGLPSGFKFTIILYVDHNLGTVIKDGFVQTTTVERVVEIMTSVDADQHVTSEELLLPDARARLEAAMSAGDELDPPLETDSWPDIRPLLEASLRGIADGGRPYQRPVFTAAQVRQWTEGFFASGYGRDHDNADARRLIDSWMDFGLASGPGDPLRHSPVSVELLLTDWTPRRLPVAAPALIEVPRLLADFVRYCHALRGIPAELTGETITSIDQFTGEFLATAGAAAPVVPDVGGVDRTDGFTGAALFAASRHAGPASGMRSALSRSVGGEEVLDGLDTRPLPDEPFDWSGVDEDIRARVGEIVDLADGCCDECLDGEHRTAVRRYLAKVARSSPEIFRRRGAAKTAAGAACWVIAKANHTLRSSRGRLTSKDLLANLGVNGTVSQRAEVQLRALGLNHYGMGFEAMDLGMPDLLVSRRRADIIDLRDRYTAVS